MALMAHRIHSPTATTAHIATDSTLIPTDWLTVKRLVNQCLSITGIGFVSLDSPLNACTACVSELRRQITKRTGEGEIEREGSKESQRGRERERCSTKHRIMDIFYTNSLWKYKWNIGTLCVFAITAQSKRVSVVVNACLKGLNGGLPLTGSRCQVGSHSDAK